MQDFPDWFIDFANEQLEDFPKTIEYFEDKSHAELQIAYIKAWSVIEIFAKIIKVLADKRAYLKEIKPKLEQLATAKIRLNAYEGKLRELINFYEDSINGKSDISLSFNAIVAADCKFGRNRCKRYSVSKSVIANEKLPNKEEIGKSLKILPINPPDFYDFLNAKDKPSNYYDTRNKIAHSGVAGISKLTLIKSRLLPVMEISLKIREYTKNSLHKRKDSKELITAK